jgi:type II secretory pathway predicted ATPase ExeA
VVELPPIKQPGDFLAFRFQRAGACLEDVFSPDGIEELHDQLIVARGLNSAGVYLGYPLAISNFAIAAMNLAAELGFDLVDADIVRQVQP